MLSTLCARRFSDAAMIQNWRSFPPTKRTRGGVSLHGIFSILEMWAILASYRVVSPLTYSAMMARLSKWKREFKRTATLVTVVLVWWSGGLGAPVGCEWSP